MGCSGLTPRQAEEAIESSAFGVLTAELRRAEAHHLDVESQLSRAVAARELEDAEDLAAVLCSRITTAVARDAGAGRSSRSPQLIVGLIPRAIGPMSAEMRLALDERIDLIEARASAVLEDALAAGNPWTRDLGSLLNPGVPPRWRQHACVVAAYRDRYGIVGSSALGPVPQTKAQRRDAAHARAALVAAKRLAEGSNAFAEPGPYVTAGREPVRIQI
jgi:hypothetical protein